MDSQLLSLVLSEVKDLQKDVEQVSRDMSAYQSAHEKSSRDRFEVLNAGVQHLMGGQKSLLERVDRLECS